MFTKIQKSMKKATVLLLAALLLLTQCTALLPAGVFMLPANVALAEETNNTEGTNNLDGSKIEGIYLEWITPDGCFVTEEFFRYALPLIQGEPERVTEQSLPRYARLKKVLAK